MPNVQADGKGWRRKLQTDTVKKSDSFFSRQATSRLIVAALSLCPVFLSPALAQPDSGAYVQVRRAQFEFNNGNYLKAIELANIGAEKARKGGNTLLTAVGFDVKAVSQIALSEISERQFDAALKTLDEALREISKDDSVADQRALIYMHYAWLYRAQHEFPTSFYYSKKAVAEAPKNDYIRAAHYLNMGRGLFASGYDLSAIVWLEKAEKLLETKPISGDKIDIFRFLSLAWRAKLNYREALKYAGKCESLAAKSSLRYKHRQSLLNFGSVLSSSGQERRAIRKLQEGLILSEKEDDSYLAANFLSTLLLHTLDSGDAKDATNYLTRLERSKVRDKFAFEIKLGQGIIAALENRPEISEQIFADIGKEENSSDFPLLYWKLAIAERAQQWEQVVKINEELLELTKKWNYRDGLPKIYLNFAKAYFNLNDAQTSEEYLRRSLALIEGIKKSENNNLGLGLSENYHEAYRLLAQLKLENPQESFELADFLKGRLLKDRIDGAATKYQMVISPEIRRLEEISLKYLDDHSFASQLEKNERSVTNAIPDLTLAQPDLSLLDQLPDLQNTAIISYCFTSDRRLLAFVWEKNKPLRANYLPVSEAEVEFDANASHQKIKSFIFFKGDGKKIFDKLLKPLSLSADHYVIIPDKYLWKIPFQALSPDGEKYLIEQKVISYAPSVSLLLEQLKASKPVRRTFQSFANAVFNDRFLRYANREATAVAGMYKARPILNATISDFRAFSVKADMLHFSMHAQVDSDQPLESFLGFKATEKNDGRVTVENILNSTLKKGSFVFVASCDTNSVISGEGLVSLAWGMMGAGATTVISAQWEADDKLTGVFSKTFYKYYKENKPSAVALQRATLELIGNKTNNMREPYYWANFSLNGDFR